MEAMLEGRVDEISAGFSVFGVRQHEHRQHWGGGGRGPLQRQRLPEGGLRWWRAVCKIERFPGEL